MMIEITLNNAESLCYLCGKCSDVCEWVRGGGLYLPEFVDKYLSVNTKKSGNLYVIRKCRNFIADPGFIKRCSSCGREYILQASHTQDVDGGICYECHQALGMIYAFPQNRSCNLKKRSVRVKTCAVCGKKFQSSANNAKYCSDQCRRQAASRLNRLAYGRKKNKFKQACWERENAICTARLKAKNLTEIVTKQYNSDKLNVIREYNSQKDNYEDQWLLAKTMALHGLETAYQNKLAEIDRELRLLTEQAEMEFIKAVPMDRLSKKKRELKKAVLLAEEGDKDHV